MTTDIPGYTRRDFLRTAAGALAVSALPRAGLTEAAKDMRPNIVLFISDDHGMGDAGCYGNPVIRTPGLDAFAEEGVRFINSFCTTASCSASRSVILTGLHNHANGQYGHMHGANHFSSFNSVKSLPVRLAAAGYRTASIGKYHTAPESVYHFEEYLDSKQASPEQMADRCRPFISADDPKPFFLHFATIEPHRSFLREGSSPVDPKDVIVPPWMPDIPECRNELAQYYMSVERMDKGLARLVQVLKETGKWDNTVFVYVSDNGVAFPGAKTTVYEPGIRLPFVVRSPECARGIESRAMITYTDITPTILDFAQALPDEPDTFHGRSFRSTLNQPDPPGWDEIYASHTFHEITMYYPMRVVRERRYKLIWNIAHELEYPSASDLWKSETWQGVIRRGGKNYGVRSVGAYLHRPEFELYDIEYDPWEINNLADDPAHAARLADMKAKIKAFQERTHDPWVSKWTYE